MRTTVIYKLYSAKINKSFISYTTNMKRVVFNLKSYLKTGIANRSKSREIIAQGDYEITVLQKYEGVPHNQIMTEINRFKSEEDPDVLESKWSMGRPRMRKGHIVARCTTRLAHNSVIIMRTARKSTGETF